MIVRLLTAVSACALFLALPVYAGADVDLTPMEGTPLTNTGGGGPMESADFNSDGFDDLAISSGQPVGGGIRIRLSNGDGGWTEGHTLEQGKATGSVTSDDFDLDGKPDLLVHIPHQTDRYGLSGSFRIYLGDGDGTFTAGQTLTLPGDKILAMPSTSQAFKLNDLNGDGFKDLFLGLLRGQLGIALGQADGTFSPVQTITSFPEIPTGDFEGFSSINTADFNGDGIRDFVFGLAGNLIGESTEENSGFYVMYGNSASGSSFETPQHIPMFSPFGIALSLIPGDFDRDGFDDLILQTGESDGTASRFWLYPGSQSGFATVPVRIADSSETSVGLAGDDFSADGFLDLAWVERSSSGTQANASTLRVATGGTGALWTTQPRTFGLNLAAGQGFAESTEIGDFDGDGYPDLAVNFNSGNCAASSCGVVVLLNRPVPVSSRASFDFGSSQAGSPITLPFTITNTGGAPARLGEVTVTGSQPGKFSLNGSCGLVAPGSACSQEISFDRSTVGTWTSEIRITFRGASE
ncbi:MAG: VCBS repeat-containing protein, partial [Solirubrobacterales bacterium]|nr:VCBS repeat-containing protein [Solirubrobacterales bacterium]